MDKLFRGLFSLLIFSYFSLYIWAGQEYYDHLKDIKAPGYARAALFAALLLAGSAIWDISKHLIDLKPKAFQTTTRSTAFAFILLVAYAFLFSTPFLVKITPLREFALALSPFIVIGAFACCFLAIQFGSNALKAAINNAE